MPAAQDLSVGRRMLEGLNDIDWDRLTHAYGPAGEIPSTIRMLQSDDPAEWVGAMSDLYDALCHQMCSIYPATVPAISFLIELLGDQRIRCRGRILQFLADVTFVANYVANQEDDDSADPQLQGELGHHAREAIWNGFDTYMKLSSDLDPTIRITAPYLLGTVSQVELPNQDANASIAERLKTQFEEEPNELVRASLVFGLACLTRSDAEIENWLEERVSDGHSSSPVRMAAAMNLADTSTAVSEPVLNTLVLGLENQDETNRLFQSVQPEMESRHHPIGRVVLELDGPVVEADDTGRTEDLKFPWYDRSERGCGTLKILELLSRLKAGAADDLLPAIVPYLDGANEYTGDYEVIPILRLVFGDKKISPDTKPEELSPVERTVLLRLFNNVRLWATNTHQDMFEVSGLGNRRADWARVLNADPGFSDSKITEILHEKMKDEGHSEPGDVRALHLCRIGSPEFFPHLRSYPNLEILDFADTSLADDDLKQLAYFGRLKKLRLNNTPVSDAGIENLLALSNLEEIYLGETKVTDQCLHILASLPDLRYIYLAGTGVTDAAAEDFVNQHPACRISR